MLRVEKRFMKTVTSAALLHNPGKPTERSFMTNLKPAVTQLRKENRSKIYRFIYHSPEPVSKQEIMMALGFSLPTVHKTITELLEANLILPGEMQPSTGGRRAVGYMANKDGWYALGVSLTKNQLRFLASDIGLKELAYKKIPLEHFESKEIGHQIEREQKQFLSENGLDPEKLLGVGITLPGVIDREADKVVLSPTLQMKNLSLSLLREGISAPVYIENESTASGFAEWLVTMEEGISRDFVYLSLENGVGGAIFLNGKPYTGCNERSAEFGHMTIVPGGLPCNCGRKGCLEAYLSMLRFGNEFGLSAEGFFEELEKERKEGEEGEKTRFWNEYLEVLSLGIHNLRMAYDCDVVLGGAMVPFLEPYLPVLKEKLTALHIFDECADYVQLAHFPVRSGMMGVAWHFTHEFVEGV